MKPVKEFSNPRIKFVLTDIDGTLTDEGQLGAEAYEALWKIRNRGLHVVPVTGRPAGWCELIARLWPVSGVVGENGGLYFRYDPDKKIMKRHFFFQETEREANRKKLELIKSDVLREVKGCAVASDQFSRLMDLAIDFAEDVAPLDKPAIQKIVSIFERHGAQAKISNIHVNGWFGEYNKISMILTFLNREFGLTEEDARIQCTFVGDSPNDEPSFEFFPDACAVANIRDFMEEIRHKPGFVASQPGGLGFSEIADAVLRVHESC